MQALFGITRPSKGACRIDDSIAVIRSTAEAIEHGIVYVPEDRGRQGVVKGLPIFQNITLPSLTTHLARGLPAAGQEFALSREYTQRLDLRAASLDQDVGLLSGGNQQKVVIAKWLATKPRVIILDEPTKGIDIGSKAAVHEFMAELAAQGLAVIMVSSEIPEILGMSDRVIVMREGRIVAELRRRGDDARGAGPRRRRHRRPPHDRAFLQIARGAAGAGHPRAGRADRHALSRPLSSRRTSPRVFNDTAPLIILALGQMIVILTKCIDLSVAANLALNGMVAAMLNGMGVPLAADPAGRDRAWARLLGAVNGLLVWKVGIPSIVVTLGTMTIYRGTIFLISDGKWINAHEMTDGFKAFPRAHLLGLPVMSWIAHRGHRRCRGAAAPHGAGRAASSRWAATRMPRSIPASTWAAPRPSPSCCRARSPG